MPTNSEITEQILGAWDEVVADENGVDGEELETQETEPVETEATTEEEEPEETEEEADEEEAEETDDEVEEEEPEEEEEVAAEEKPAIDYETDDLEVKAFLSKYDGDVDKALKGAAELSHVLGRQGNEKAELAQRVATLEDQLHRAQIYGTAGVPLNEEQLAWVEEASTSANPTAFVQRAVDEGEFELARAVCREWAREDPYNATRLGAQVDVIEQQITNYQPPVEMDKLLGAMQQQFPDMPTYATEMTSLIANLGDNHPAVIDARSNDVNVAARGVFHIYELARASSAAVRRAKDDVKATEKRNGASARKEALVSSASTAPSSNGTPRRSDFVMPGLTYEALEQELDRQSQ